MMAMKNKNMFSLKPHNRTQIKMPDIVTGLSSTKNSFKQFDSSKNIATSGHGLLPYLYVFSSEAIGQNRKQFGKHS